MCFSRPPERTPCPAFYEQYAPGYYAVFFRDPDGMKLEYVFTPRWPA